MKSIIILVTVLGLTFSLVACTGFNFTCNDYNSSELTLEEKVKSLKKCKDGNMFQWKRTF